MVLRAAYKFHQMLGFSLRNEFNVSLYVWLRPSAGSMRQCCKRNWRTIIQVHEGVGHCGIDRWALYSTKRFVISHNGFRTTTYTNRRFQDSYNIMHISIPFNMNRFVWCLGLRVNSIKSIWYLNLRMNSTCLSLCGCASVSAPRDSPASETGGRLLGHEVGHWHRHVDIVFNGRGLKPLTADFEPRLTQIEDFKAHITLSCSYQLYLNNIPFNMKGFVWCFGLHVNSINSTCLSVWLRRPIVRQPCKWNWRTIIT